MGDSLQLQNLVSLPAGGAHTRGNFIRSDADRGPSTYYFKCGVYEQDSPSLLMQSEWANLKVWRAAPRILSLAMTGTGLVLTGTNGTPGTACYVLTSTNLNVPAADWTFLPAGNFDSHGSIVFTNAIDPAAAGEYYSLLSD